MKAKTADLGMARVDLDREARCGFPEVIFGPGKTPEAVVAIARTVVEHHGAVLLTRATAEQASAMLSAFPQSARYRETARCVVVEERQLERRCGKVAVVCAGTSDLPVAEEAAVSLEFLGSPVARFTDVGVAGIHRLLAVRDAIEACEVIVVIAGMEGALPSVLAGLVSKPLIAVPTSVGYGANFGGLSALLGMLNSCGSGVTVVNIDNGFGAAYAAATIHRQIAQAREAGEAAAKKRLEEATAFEQA